MHRRQIAISRSYTQQLLPFLGVQLTLEAHGPARSWGLGL